MVEKKTYNESNFVEWIRELGDLVKATESVDNTIEQRSKLSYEIQELRNKLRKINLFVKANVPGEYTPLGLRDDYLDLIKESEGNISDFIEKKRSDLYDGRNFSMKDIQEITKLRFLEQIAK